MKCYFDWYEFSEAARILFVRRKLIGSARINRDSIVRDCMRRRVVIESCEKKKEKFKCIFEYYKNRLLDQLQNLRQGDMSVQDYITKFEDLTLRCDVREHHSHTVTRFI